MEKFILIFHFLVAVALIGLILIQQGKGAEAGASLAQVHRKLSLAAAAGGTFSVK
jgi:preprotein translocase subunit SecG